jgi:hypothetical protein
LAGVLAGIAHRSGRMSKSGVAAVFVLTRSGVLDTGIHAPEAGCNEASQGRLYVASAALDRSRTAKRWLGSPDQIAMRRPAGVDAMIAVTPPDSFLLSALVLDRTKAHASRTAQAAGFGELSKW